MSQVTDIHADTDSGTSLLGINLGQLDVYTRNIQGFLFSEAVCSKFVHNSSVQIRGVSSFQGCPYNGVLQYRLAKLRNDP